jgi:site-specific DNA recombinase
MDSGGKPVTGREYLRVSLDRSGRARSIEEQHHENQEAASARGVMLGEPYKDESISASRYSTKARDGFGKLLADLERGRFGADELWLWEASRGSRKVGEWVQLIELCEQQRVQICVTTHNRTYDPANGRDRRTLLEDAVDSEFESGKISARAKRAAAANAAAGKPHGRAPYGYRRRYDERTRKMITQEPEPAEAAMIRELFDRVKAGHSLRSIALDFQARGFRTRTGKVFSPQHLRVLATTAAYAGLRVHDAEGRAAGRGHSPQPGTHGVSVVKGT